jgi:hypothetical protein
MIKDPTVVGFLLSTSTNSMEQIPSDLILLDLITVTVFPEQYKS